VRQAMSALVNEGLLERVRGRGTFVRPLPPAASLGSPAVGRRIGLVLAHSSGSQLDLDILIGVEHAPKSRGYQVSFAYAEETLDELDRDIARLRADLVAGMIIFPVSDATYNESICHLAAKQISFIICD